MKIVAGLGNPGARYARTRHNAGFWVVDRVARAWNLAFEEAKFEARAARGAVAGETVLLVKPQTFMNLSGTAVAPLARWWKVEPDAILVVHDDLDLPEGRLRVRRGGGDGGHKGLESVIRELGGAPVPRLRLGIGRSDLPAEDWVLKAMTEEERAAFDPAVERAAEAVECWIREGIETCMNRTNAAGD